MHPLPAQLVSLLFLAAPAVDGWLGVYLSSDGGQPSIVEVIPGSPAAKAGLQSGDVLLAVGDAETASSEDFIAAIRAASVGDRVRIKIRRQGKESTVVVKLGARPETVAAAPAAPTERVRGLPARPSGEEQAPATEPRGYLGVSARQTDSGVVIDRVLPGSPAASGGLQEGELLATVGDRKILSLADLDEAMAKAPAGSTVALGLRGKDGVRSVLVELGKAPGSGARSVEKKAAAQPLHEHEVEGHLAPVTRTAPAKTTRPSVPEVATTPALPAPAAKSVDVERELESLRAELRDLRRQLEELRKHEGRE